MARDANDTNGKNETSDVNDNGIDERKRAILRAIITDYIASAEPVGSRTIAKKYGLGVSAATIRNEMADLETLGYLEHIHTSSGRVPSSKGYRLYVDDLQPPAAISEAERKLIDRWKKARARRIDEIFKETARLISRITGNVSLLLAPPLDGGHARLYLGGASMILAQPEFQSVGKIKEILILLEEEEPLMELLFSRQGDEMTVAIGSENQKPISKDLSLITVTYRLGGELLGSLAVVGPKRMQYGKAISLLNLLNAHIEDVVKNLF